MNLPEPLMWSVPDIMKDFEIMTIAVNLKYFALLREQRRESAEEVHTTARTARELYHELKAKYHFSLSPDLVRVAINNEFKDWDATLKSGDQVVFIPPVAGG
jgi:molybdopterin synthase sulfur carrier subunit